MIDLFQIRKIRNELTEAEMLIVALKRNIAGLKEDQDSHTERKPLLYTIFVDDKEESVMIVADSFRTGYGGYRFFLNDRCVTYFEEIQGFLTDFIAEETE